MSEHSMIDLLDTPMSTQEASEALEAAPDFLERAEEYLDICRAEIAHDLQRGMERGGGISQAEIARRLDLDRQQVNQLLREQGNNTIWTLSRLASALGLHLVIRMLAEDEAMPVVPASSLGDVQRIMGGRPTAKEKALTQQNEKLGLELLKQTQANGARIVPAKSTLSASGRSPVGTFATST